MDPAPFIRGCVYPGTRSVAYPRADPADSGRLPLDTWTMAQIPASVRLELTGDAEAIEISYDAAFDEGGYRGEEGKTFQCWAGHELVSSEKAEKGGGRVHLTLPSGPAIVYLPEWMRPRLLDIQGTGGSIEPGPRGPRWIAYGDSILEGWVAASPALAWPAVVARTHSLDLVNMGYAGAARGEIPSAEQIASLPADVISISYGTNCWSRIPFTPGMMREGFRAFLDVVRQGHPSTPIVVGSPILRLDGETKPNRLGATLADLRAAMEEVCAERSDLTLVTGRDLVDKSMLADDVHPNDEGHRTLAAALGPVVAGAVS